MKNNALNNIVSIINKLENSAVILLLITMLGFAVLQIILRNFFQSGIIWAEPFLRILVLWTALLGAMIASRNGNHININLLTKYLPLAYVKYTTLLCQLFTAITCAIVAYYSFIFVLMEKESADLAFANVPLWFCESIIPFSFAVISIRYFLLAINNFIKHAH